MYMYVRISLLTEFYVFFVPEIASPEPPLSPSNSELPTYGQFDPRGV